jgi:hypothetical protein
MPAAERLRIAIDLDYTTQSRQGRRGLVLYHGRCTAQASKPKEIEFFLENSISLLADLVLL